MTPEERKAAADAMRAEIAADRATPRAKQDDTTTKVEKPAAAPPPSPNVESGAEANVDEILKRTGGYLRNQHTDHMN